MKRLLISFLFLLFLLKLEAQIRFCPPGAQWRYRFEQYNLSPIQLNYNVTYFGDTIVSGDTLKVLGYNSFFRYAPLQAPPFIAFVKQRGDTIFMKSLWTNNQWQILYNFAAIPGQSWTNNFGVDSYTTTVNAVDTVMLNTTPVRRLKVTYKKTSAGGSYQGFISEYIGSSDYFFNYNTKLSSDPPVYKEFLCYRDNTLGTIQFGTKPCNYSNLAGIEEQLAGRGLKVYPNPVYDQLNIEAAEGSQIIISDVNGRIVDWELLNESRTINTTELAPGIYFLQIRHNQELVYKTKVLKE